MESHQPSTGKQSKYLRQKSIHSSTTPLSHSPEPKNPPAPPTIAIRPIVKHPKQPKVRRNQTWDRDRHQNPFPPSVPFPKGDGGEEDEAGEDTDDESADALKESKVSEASLEARVEEETN
jgi:hypothetical protein